MASQDSLKVVTKLASTEVVVPDVVPDIELVEGTSSKLKPENSGEKFDPSEKNRESIRRQKSILKNQKTQSSEDSSKLASGETTAS